MPSSPKLELFVQPNPSYGFMPSDNLTETEIAANKAEYEAAERIEDLEFAVIEAAVKWYSDDGERTPLANAVESLLREREGK